MSFSPRVVTALATSGLAAAASAAQDANPLALDNGPEAVFAYSDPSVPGDLVWTATSGAAQLAHGEGGGVLGSCTVEVDSFVLAYFDTDWSTTDSFYDMVVGPAVPSVANPGNLEPDFFQTGGLTPSDVLVSIGSAGFLPPLGCPPPGLLSGYTVSFGFGDTVGSGIAVPADGTAASGLATTLFLPGGMTLSGGTCGIGAYVLQDLKSTDETQADDLGGISAFGGFQLGSSGAGPTPDLVTESASWWMGLRESVLAVVGDSGTGVLEQGDAGAGATNGLKLPVAGGAARLSYALHAGQDAGTSNLAFAGTSLSPLACPGTPFLGAALLVAPDSLLLETAAATGAAGIPVGAGGVADWTSAVTFAVPAAAVGTAVWSQGLVLETATGAAHGTNRVRTLLLP